MTHSRNEGRWSAVPAIGGLFAALLILSSCAREASSPVSPETAVVASSIQSAAKAPASGFTLTVTLAGSGNGMVKSSPNGIACGGTVNKGGNGGNGGNCNGSFDLGSSVTLTATGIGGSAFVGWSGDACDGSATPICTVTPDVAKNVVATFSKGVVIYYTLTVTETGTGTGTVTSTPAGINCPTTCTFSFAAGTKDTLTAVDDPSSGYTFGGWSSNCTVLTAGTCEVTIDAATTVTATFVLPPPPPPTSYVLTMTVYGVGDVLSSGGNDCGNDAFGTSYTCVPFTESTSTNDVTFTASSINGSVFKEWGGDASGCLTVSPCTVTRKDALNVTATFAGGGPTASLARSESGASSLRSINSASVTSGLLTTRSAFIEQQR